MKQLLIIATLVISSNAFAVSYCTPGVSKACGQGCIPVEKLCRKSWTTAINGERPTTAKKSYANPTKVSKPPTDAK